MNYYNFLLGKSYRTDDFKAPNLRAAWIMAKRWYQALPAERKEAAGSLLPVYQWCKEGDYVMSGWLDTTDKRIIKEVK